MPISAARPMSTSLMEKRVGMDEDGEGVGEGDEE